MNHCRVWVFRDRPAEGERISFEVPALRLGRPMEIIRRFSGSGKLLLVFRLARENELFSGSEDILIFEPDSEPAGIGPLRVYHDARLVQYSEDNREMLAGLKPMVGGEMIGLDDFLAGSYEDPPRPWKIRPGRRMHFAIDPDPGET